MVPYFERTRSPPVLPLKFNSIVETYAAKHLDLSGTTHLSALEALRCYFKDLTVSLRYT